LSVAHGLVGFLAFFDIEQSARFALPVENPDINIPVLRMQRQMPAPGFFIGFPKMHQHYGQAIVHKLPAGLH
jgi:hypothetical protein